MGILGTLYHGGIHPAHAVLACASEETGRRGGALKPLLLLLTNGTRREALVILGEEKGFSPGSTSADISEGRC